MAEKKVLVMEDEKPLAHALDLKLQSAGFKTVIAGDGEEAVALFDKNKCDIILLDLIVPKMDGFKVLEYIRSKDKKIPVFVLSNLEQEEDKTRVKNLGANGYYVKANTPISEIVALVKKNT